MYFIHFIIFLNLLNPQFLKLSQIFIFRTLKSTRTRMYQI